MRNRCEDPPLFSEQLTRSVFRKIVNRRLMCCDERFFPLCGRASCSFELEIVKANAQTIEWTFSRNGSFSARLFHSVLCTLVFIRAFVFVRPRSFAACVSSNALFHARYSAYAWTNTHCPRNVLFRAQVCMWRNYRLIYIISFHSELNLVPCNVKFIILEIPACFLIRLEKINH